MSRTPRTSRGSFSFLFWGVVLALRDLESARAVSAVSYFMVQMPPPPHVLRGLVRHQTCYSQGGSPAVLLSSEVVEAGRSFMGVH